LLEDVEDPELSYIAGRMQNGTATLEEFRKFFRKLSDICDPGFDLSTAKKKS
jgi:hypothetical protein